MARPKKLHMCSNCGLHAPGICADCQDELDVEVYVCERDKCRATHVKVFHERISFEDFSVIQ